MIARYAIGIVALIASAPALAEPLDAEAAQRFVLGKLFAFTCFDGSRGAGRVYGDGSVMGTVQLRGAGSIYSVLLPAGTLKVKRETVCASLSGIPFEPCFELNRTDDQGFRGSVSGLDFAYCDFVHRPDMNGKRAHLQPSSRCRLIRRVTAGRLVICSNVRGTFMEKKTLWFATVRFGGLPNLVRLAVDHDPTRMCAT
jgi:hypothetical protein